MINREDMLELTRRMTVARSNFVRLAGAYFDNEGFIDGTFNTNFLNLSASDRAKYLELAKAVIFSDTNVELKEYDAPSNEISQLLDAINMEDLKNDALMDTLYELIGEELSLNYDFGIYVFKGRYDIPLKGSDNESQWESEEVYNYLICSIFPVDKDYEPGTPVGGFLYPAFKDRSSDSNHILIYKTKH